jgi:ATP synthase protein I
MSLPEDLRSQDRKLEESVGKRVQRMKEAEKSRRTLLGQSVYLGSLGLMFVLPVIAGAYLGEWLDSLAEGFEVRWTISLIFLGIIVGAANVYFFLRE